MFNLQNYRNMFFDESDELFGVIDTVLLDTEACGYMEEESINSLFRALHTLKGNSASVEMHKFASLAHEVEFFIDKLRKREFLYEYPMARVLMEVVDTLREILELEIAERLSEDHYLSTKRELIEKLSHFRVESRLIEQKDIHLSVQEKKESEFDDFGFFDTEFRNKEESEDNDSFGFFYVIETDESAKNAVIMDEPEIALSSSIKSNAASVKNADSGALKANRAIRVNLEKVDQLMNNVGELVITHSILMQYAKSLLDQRVRKEITDYFNILERQIRELQDSVLGVRMVPMETVFSKFPKLVRDTAFKVKKQVEFISFGENVEIDKAMTEGLTDALTHIVRNAIDHGIETPDERMRCNKTKGGTIQIHAEQVNGHMLIQVIDDGGGINLEKVCSKAIENGFLTEQKAQKMGKEEKAMLIFSPGLSTAGEVTDLSGRGVGMDVVMSNIKKIGGTVTVETERRIGTTITMALPLTLAIIDGLNIQIGDRMFILPVSVMLETIHPNDEMIKWIGKEDSEILMLRDEFIPIVRLHKVFNILPKNDNLSKGVLIVVQSLTRKIAIAIDEFFEQQQFVVKPLNKNFRNVHGIGGATVRGDGTVGLIIDTASLLV